MATDPKSPPPLQFGEPEKRSWLGIVLLCLFVVAAVGCGVWIYKSSPPLRRLDCDTTSGTGSLTSFGNCHEAG